MPGTLPPSVTITNPAGQRHLEQHRNVTIGASASDTDGSVTNVQFFDGAVLLLGNDSTSPSASRPASRSARIR